MNILAKILSLVSKSDSESVSINVSTGFKTENPSVELRRQEAINKMNEMGRLSILDGDKFTLENTCLRKYEGKQ